MWRAGADARVLWAGVGVFVVVFAVHVRSPVTTSSDSRWTVPTALSLVRERNTDLDEFPDWLQAHGFACAERHRGHWYGEYPLGPALVALPAVLVMHPFKGTDLLGRYRKIERLVGSAVVALTAVIALMLAARRVGLAWAIVVALVFAFGTSSWSSASRALWAHGPSMLTLALTLYFLVRGRDDPAWVPYAGLSLALSYVMRPTNAIPIVVLAAYVFVRFRPQFRSFLLWAAVVAGPFLTYNLLVYGALLSPYYLGHAPFRWSTFPEGAAGTLLSPSRGLLVFSPVLVFAIWGAVARLREARDGLDGCLAGIVAAHWLLISAWSSWWGGHSYGPRLFCDMLPFMTYFLIFGLERMAGLVPPRRAALVATFAVLALVSGVINGRAACSWSVWQWNMDRVRPDNGSEAMWDLRDPQFLRGLRG